LKGGKEEKPTDEYDVSRGKRKRKRHVWQRGTILRKERGKKKRLYPHFRCPSSRKKGKKRSKKEKKRWAAMSIACAAWGTKKKKKGKKNDSFSPVRKKKKNPTGCHSSKLAAGREKRMYRGGAFLSAPSRKEETGRKMASSLVLAQPEEKK